MEPVSTARRGPVRPLADSEVVTGSGSVTFSAASVPENRISTATATSNVRDAHNQDRTANGSSEVASGHEETSQRSTKAIATPSTKGHDAARQPAMQNVGPREDLATFGWAEQAAVVRAGQKDDLYSQELVNSVTGAVCACTSACTLSILLQISVPVDQWQSDFIVTTVPIGRYHPRHAGGNDGRGVYHSAQALPNSIFAPHLPSPYHRLWLSHPWRGEASYTALDAFATSANNRCLIFVHSICVRGYVYVCAVHVQVQHHRSENACARFKCATHTHTHKPKPQASNVSHSGTCI